MKLVILGPMGVPSDQIRALAADIVVAPVSIEIHEQVDPTPEGMIPFARDAEVLIIANLPFPADVVAACPGLRMVCAAFSGLDRVDVGACASAGVQVCSVPGYSTPAVAEFTLGLILAVLRKVVAADGAARSGGTFRGLKGGELAGRTVGIVGTGAIGGRVAALLQPFGCPLLGYDRVPNLDAEALGLTYVDMDTLVAESDVVTLHLPLSGDTDTLIDGRRLALMRPHGILINTARGAIVDNGALARALVDGKLAGAGLDTIDVRPPLPADHPLLKAPNVTLTPHMAFATAEAFVRRTRLALETVADWQRGTPRNLASG